VSCSLTSVIFSRLMLQAYTSLELREFIPATAMQESMK
jgi:hypothetical protein